MVSSKQLRAARAHLDLSQDDVAAAASITKSTLSNIERGATEASSRSLQLLQAFYERRGLRFTDEDGIRAVKNDVICFEGADGFHAFMIDVIETLTREPGTYCVSNVDEKNWLKWLGVEEAVRLRDRISSIPGIFCHILVKEGDNMQFAPYADYRYVSADLFYDNTSYYVYADKLALIRFEPDNVIVRILHNRYFTESFKLMFYRFWDMNAQPMGENKKRKIA
jgi:transcriptional regulator with XRE-family HTH domain